MTPDASAINTIMDIIKNGGPATIAVLALIALYFVNKERKHFLTIILDVIPKQTQSLNKLRRLIAGKELDDEEDSD